MECRAAGLPFGKHEQSRAPCLGCRYVVAHPLTVIWTPQTANNAKLNFALRLYESVDSAITTLLDLPPCTINLPLHATPNTPEDLTG